MMRRSRLHAGASATLVPVIELPRWADFLRVAANGRWECSCHDCGRMYWLTPAERDWVVCPHCVGWWVLEVVPGDLVGGSPTPPTSPTAPAGAEAALLAPT